MVPTLPDVGTSQSAWKVLTAKLRLYLLTTTELQWMGQGPYVLWMLNGNPLKMKQKGTNLEVQAVNNGDFQDNWPVKRSHEATKLVTSNEL